MILRPDRLPRLLGKGLIVGASLGLVVFVRLALSLASYRRLAPLLPNTRRPLIRIGRHRLIRSVRMAARVVPRASCLTQAVSARILCALFGHDTLIRIGVRRDDRGGIAAHAWLVDREERVLLGGTRAELSGFTPLVDLALEPRG